MKVARLSSTCSRVDMPESTVITLGRLAAQRRAQEAAGLCTGDCVELSGRIQSRPYIKLIDGLAVEKTAFEVSVAELRRL